MTSQKRYVRKSVFAMHPARQYTFLTIIIRCGPALRPAGGSVPHGCHAPSGSHVMKLSLDFGE
jgi:hypothetical protein